MCALVTEHVTIYALYNQYYTGHVVSVTRPDLHLEGQIRNEE